jgi:hypothetical protein
VRNIARTRAARRGWAAQCWAVGSAQAGEYCLAAGSTMKRPPLRRAGGVSLSRMDPPSTLAGHRGRRTALQRKLRSAQSRIWQSQRTCARMTGSASLLPPSLTLSILYLYLTWPSASSIAQRPGRKHTDTECPSHSRNMQQLGASTVGPVLAANVCPCKPLAHPARLSCEGERSAARSRVEHIAPTDYPCPSCLMSLQLPTC